MQSKAAARRDAIQKQSEEARKSRDAAAQPRSKVSKRDVITLKTIFDELDVDKNGKVTLAELQSQLSKKRAEAMRYDGLERSAQQRRDLRSLEQSGIHHFADTLVAICDVSGDRDGTIDFDELLRTLYPNCTEREYAAMHSYVAPPEEPAPPTAVERLSATEREEICAIFRLYDTDGSGRLSSTEWAAAAVRCGLSQDEERRWFDVLSNRDCEPDAGEDGGAGVGGDDGEGTSDRVIRLDAFVTFMADSVAHWRAGPQQVGADGLRYARPAGTHSMQWVPAAPVWVMSPPKPRRRAPRGLPPRLQPSPRRRSDGALPQLASPHGAAEPAAPAPDPRAPHPLERALDAALRRRAARRAQSSAAAAAYSIRPPAQAVILAAAVEARSEERRKENEERRLNQLIADAIAF